MLKIEVTHCMCMHARLSEGLHRVDAKYIIISSFRETEMSIHIYMDNTIINMACLSLSPTHMHTHAWSPEPQLPQRLAQEAHDTDRKIRANLRTSAFVDALCLQYVCVCVCTCVCVYVCVCIYVCMYVWRMLTRCSLCVECILRGLVAPLSI